MEMIDEPPPGYQQPNREERDLGIGHAPIHHARPIHHPVHHAPVHHAPVHHAPLVHHAPAPYAPPPAPYVPPVKAHHAPAYDGPDRPYTYEYGVSDAYSGSQFNQVESKDQAGVVVGSYSVALPDGRVQHVKYNADPYGGYVAEVSYEGTAAYPDLPHGGYKAPHHVPKAPAYAPPAPVYHPPRYAPSDVDPVYVAAPKAGEPVVAAEAPLPVYHSKIDNVGY